MILPAEIRTDRLVLRHWRTADRAAFAAMNADPRVMEYLPKLLTRDESHAAVARIEKHFAQRGFGFWAIEIAGTAPFIGFVGLQVPRFEAHFTPCVEIGWRLAADQWGRGYASEAARATLAFGFDRLGLEQIVSFTVPANVRSRQVMQRIGMAHDPADDFDHPLLAGHPLQRQVLYRVRKSNWKACQDQPRSRDRA
jgi:RimJ/RimL family protein N-acetyltransferase